MMKKLILFISYMLILITSVNGAEAKSEYAVQNKSPLVPIELIQEAGWSDNWELNLPLKPNEQVDQMAIFDSFLLILTNSNVMFSIDRQSGRVRFTKQLSVAQLPVQKPLYYESKFWFMVGSEMLVFDPAMGDFTIKEKFPQVGNSSEFGFARNKNYLYISGSDDRIHAINTDGYWQQFTATADNDSAIVSIIATDEIVVFATQAGNVVGMNPTKAEKVWQFDTTGQIKGQLVLDGQDVYVGSFDSKLYKLNLSRGKLLWDSPFHSGAPIRNSFTVGKDLVYLYNSLNGLYGINKQSGKAVWQVPLGQGMICETSDKGFVFVSPGIVRVMDNQTGKELYSVNVSGVQRYAMNTVDGTMYLADTTGRLMSVTAR